MNTDKVLVSEIDGLGLYRPEILENCGEVVLAQECAEPIEGRSPFQPGWEGFIILPWEAN